MEAAQRMIIGVVLFALLALTLYSRTGTEPTSAGYSRTEGLKALAGGYGLGKGKTDELILTEDEDW